MNLFELRELVLDLGEDMFDSLSPAVRKKEKKL